MSAPPPSPRRRVGEGRPFVFQHGLGGGLAQIDGLLGREPMAGLSRLTQACRGHDGVPLGPSPSLAAFADDLEAWLAGVLDPPDAAVLGGVSMGAALALHLATRGTAPAALVLVRPAWGPEGAPPHLRPLRDAAALMRHQGSAGRDAIARTEAFEELRLASPDNAASVLAQFDAPDLDERAALLDALAMSPLRIEPAALAALRVPTLVISCPDDAMHPQAVAEEMRGALGGRHVEAPSKSRDPAAHAAAVREAIAAFLAAALA